MHDFEEFILKNINLLILIAFVFAPMILKALAKNRRNTAKRMQGPEMTEMKPKAQIPAEEGANLEGKIRKFFEELTEESHFPKPAKRPEPVDNKDIMAPAPADKRFPAGPGADPGGADRAFPEFSMESPGLFTEADALPTEAPTLPAETYSTSVFEKDRSVDSSSYKLKSLLPVNTSWEQKVKPRTGVWIFGNKLSRSHLRQAIVLKEILDRPLGLRD